MNKEKFVQDWEQAFDLRLEILNAKSISESESLFRSNPLHPLSLYGRLDYALNKKDKEVVEDCMVKVIKFLSAPLPNTYFEFPTNDPIGEIMLKPFIVFPLLSSPFDEPSTKQYTDWILTGFVYLFKSYQQQGIKAFDSLRTMGKVLEQNNDDFTFLIFGRYLGLHEPINAYVKFLIFTFFYSGAGYQQFNGDVEEFTKLTEAGEVYAKWLNERNQPKDLAQLLDEGQEIATKLFNKVITDINEGTIKVEELIPPKLKLKISTEFADPVEQVVIESVKNLSIHKPNYTTEDLEAEAIYLAAYLYLKDDPRIDFQIDYLTQDLLVKIENANYEVADQVFHYMFLHFPKKYGFSELSHGINGYKMNIQLASNYSSHIKNYFIRAHKIGDGADYSHFSSPRNCLWRDNKIRSDSPTQRDVYYKLNESNFELMIPPYNPLVTGLVVDRSHDTIKCQSKDDTRTFIFHFKGECEPKNLDFIEMYRNDKGDMVSYHKK